MNYKVTWTGYGTKTIAADRPQTAFKKAFGPLGAGFVLVKRPANSSNVKVELMEGGRASCHTYAAVRRGHMKVPESFELRCVCPKCTESTFQAKGQKYRCNGCGAELLGTDFVLIKTTC